MENPWKQYDTEENRKDYEKEQHQRAGDALLQVVYFDRNAKQSKTIDLSQSHDGKNPHTHHGYNHSESNSKKGFANLTAEEKAMIERVRKLWYNRRSK